MHFYHIKHGFSKYLYQIFHKKSNKAHQNTHFVILQSCFCAKLSKNVNMLKKYHILEKIIIPGRQDTLDLSKLYTNLPLDMPEGCIYFWDVSFSPFRRNIFFPKYFPKIHQIQAILDDIFVLQGIGKNTKTPFCPKIRMICYFYHLFGCIRVLKSTYFEFLAISVFQSFGKKM